VCNCNWALEFIFLRVRGPFRLHAWIVSTAQYNYWTSHVLLLGWLIECAHKLAKGLCLMPTGFCLMPTQPAVLDTAHCKLMVPAYKVCYRLGRQDETN